MTWVCVLAGEPMETMGGNFERNVGERCSEAQRFWKGRGCSEQKLGPRPPIWDGKVIVANESSLKLQNGQFNFISKENTLNRLTQKSICKLPDDRKRQSSNNHSSGLLQSGQSSVCGGDWNNPQSQPGSVTQLRGSPRTAAWTCGVSLWTEMRCQP